MNIRDFPNGHMEVREQIVVMKSDHALLGRPGVWRFLMAVDSRLGSDVWVYMPQGDVAVLEEDEAILSVATARLLDLIRADPECRLRDGRRVADVDARYLYSQLT